jgi:hypothetical protein
MGVVSAQNGTNYHVLSNGGDGLFFGVGAGGTQTDTDGIGYFIPGEDVRGSLLTDPDGGGALLPQFCYRMSAWREYWCTLVPGTITAGFNVEMPYISFIELDGLNANNNVVFLRPICQLGLTASFLAYGTGPSSTVSFLAAAVSGFPTVVLPDNGIVSGAGTATQVMAVQVPSQAAGFGCWGTQFKTAASAVPFLDNIDGIWHYNVNSTDQNQYWYFSFNEMNLTRSNTIATTGGITGLIAFPSVVDATAVLSTLEAQTTAVVAPHGVITTPLGANFVGPYYQQTENMSAPNPNRGFDVGRGSRAISFSGLQGAKTPIGWGGLGNGAQDPGYDTLHYPPAPDGLKTLGFVTWDNKPNASLAGMGSGRILWLGFDLAQIAGLTPEADPDVKKAAGTVKLPVIGTSFIQAITTTSLVTFQHTTKAAALGWPDPDFGGGAGSGSFGVPAIAGGSLQTNVGGFVAKIPCAGAFPVNITYGTTGKDLSPPPTFTWDPSIADISGSKEIYLWK